MASHLPRLLQACGATLAAAVAATGKTRLKQAEAAAPHATTDAGTPGLVAA
jgi:hypothetical protein